MVLGPWSVWIGLSNPWLKRGTAGCTRTRHLRCACGLLTYCYCNDCTRTKVLGKASNPLLGTNNFHNYVEKQIFGKAFPTHTYFLLNKIYVICYTRYMTRGILPNFIKASPKTERLSYRRPIPAKLKKHFTKPDGSTKCLSTHLVP